MPAEAQSPGEKKESFHIFTFSFELSAEMNTPVVKRLRPSLNASDHNTG
jgi:hypothetical protein